LGRYNKIRHNNKAAIDDLLQIAGARHDMRNGVLLIDVEEDNVVRNYVGDVFLRYDDATTINTPPLRPPALEPTTTPPLWLSSTTVTITSCPASGVPDSAIIDGLLECEEVCASEDHDEVYSDIENTLPGCIFELASSLR
jgi:hypothetical protein